MDTPAITTDHIFEFIRNRYSPAIDIADSDLHLTTDEIFIELALHFGELSITKEQLSQGLRLHDYRYDILPGSMQFVWVFKEKI